MNRVCVGSSFHLTDYNWSKYRTLRYNENYEDDNPKKAELHMLHEIMCCLLLVSLFVCVFLIRSRSWPNPQMVPLPRTTDGGTTQMRTHQGGFVDNQSKQAQMQQ